MNPQVNECFLQLRQEFERNANEHSAAKMQAYMRDQYTFFGIKSPLRREILSPFIQHIKVWELEDLRAFIQLCWDQPEREFKLAAMDIMGKNLKKMDASWIRFTISLIQYESWWDTVDFLASTVIGHLLAMYPELSKDYIDSWINDEDMWLKRTALLHQLKYKDKTDFGLLKRLILKEIDHPDFFIRKAIGWSLRQYSRYDPNGVKLFVQQNPNMSNLSKREALRLIT